MGCGMSKFDQEELDPTYNFEPTRVDELRTRQKNEQVVEPMILDSNLSLKHFIRENDKSSSAVDENHQIVKSNESSTLAEGESRHRLYNSAKGEDKLDDAYGDAEDENFERRGSLVDNPGSPSFRDYCLVNGHTSIHDEDAWGTNVRMNNVQKERGITTSNIISRKSVEKNGGSPKWRRPRYVLPKNGSKSAKHNWRVGTCYNPYLAHSHDTSYKPPMRTPVGI